MLPTQTPPPLLVKESRLVRIARYEASARLDTAIRLRPTRTRTAQLTGGRDAASHIWVRPVVGRGLLAGPRRTVEAVQHASPTIGGCAIHASHGLEARGIEARHEASRHDRMQLETGAVRHVPLDSRLPPRSNCCVDYTEFFRGFFSGKFHKSGKLAPGKRRWTTGKSRRSFTTNSA